MYILFANFESFQEATSNLGDLFFSIQRRSRIVRNFSCHAALLYLSTLKAAYNLLPPGVKEHTDVKISWHIKSIDGTRESIVELFAAEYAEL